MQRGGWARCYKTQNQQVCVVFLIFHVVVARGLSSISQSSLNWARSQINQESSPGPPNCHICVLSQCTEESEQYQSCITEMVRQGDGGMRGQSELRKKKVEQLLGKLSCLGVQITQIGCLVVLVTMLSSPEGPETGFLHVRKCFGPWPCRVLLVRVFLSSGCSVQRLTLESFWTKSFQPKIAWARREWVERLFCLIKVCS